MANLVSTLTARLIDQISGPAKSAAASIGKLSLAEKALAQAEAQRGKAANLKTQLDGLAKTRVAFMAQRKIVEDLARKQAQYAQFVGPQTKATTKLIANQAVELGRARDKLKAAALAMGEQKTAAAALRGELQSAVGPIKSLADAEAKLASNVDKARLGIEKEAMAQAHAAKMAKLKADSDALATRRLKERAEAQKRVREHVRRGVDGVLAAGGLVIGSATRKAAIEGAHYQRAKVGLQTAGVPAKDIDEAEHQAVQLQARYTNVNRSEILDTYKELRSVLLHPQEAHELLGSTIRAKSALNAIDPTGEGAHSLGFAVKGAEVLGLAQDPKRFESFLDNFIKAKQVMGELITPESIYEMAKYSKASGAFLSDRFKMTTGLSLSQEMGGSTTGVAVNQFVKQLIGGFQGPGNHSAAKTFVKLGLANESQFEKTKTGDIKGMKPGEKVQGADLAMTDPDQWVYQYLLPAMKKKGITEPKDVVSWVRRAFPNSNAADLVSKLITQQQSFENHAKLYNDAQGLNATDTIGKDPTVALNSLTTALSNFGGVLSSPIMEKAAGVMSSLASTIAGWSESLTTFQKNHPDLSQVLAGGALAGGAAAGSYGFIGAMKWLSEGFGLKGSAAALDGSAAALTRAAVVLGGKDVAGDGAKAAAGAAAAGGAGWLARVVGGAGRMIGSAGGILMVQAIANSTSPEEEKALADAKAGTSAVRGKYGDDTLRAARAAYQPWWKRSWSLDAGDSDDQSYVERYLARQNAPVVEQPRIPYGSLTRDPSMHGEALANGSYEGAVTAAQNAGIQIKEALSPTAAPTIDTSSLQAAVALAERFLSLMRSAGAAAINTSHLAPKAVPAPMTVPAYGKGD